MVYLQPFWHNSLLKCVSQPEIAKNSLNSLFGGGVQGHSRSSMSTFLKSSTLVLVMISSMSVPICNHFHVRRASGKITLFKGGAPLSPLVRRDPFTLSYGEKPKSLSYLVLDWYRVLTDGQTDEETDRRTDRITVANTRYSNANSRA